MAEQTPDWTDALCGQVDPELFFPNQAGQANVVVNQIQVAKDICNQCHLLNECLAYAIKHKYEGIWGGTTVNERQALRRKLNLMRTSPTKKV